MTIVDRTRSTPSATTRASAPARAATPSTSTPGGAVRPGPVSGAWREGDPVGHRQFVQVGDVPLERGGVIPRVQVAYETWGRLNERADNAILVEHALTGDSHVVGPPGRGAPVAGLVGRAHRAGPPARHRPVVRRRVQRPRWVPGHDRALVARRRRATVGESVPVRDGARPGRRRGPPGGRDRGAAMGGGPRRVDGRHARPRVGRDAPRPGRPRPGARQHGVCLGRPDRLGAAPAARDPVRPGLPRRRLLRPDRLAGRDGHGHRSADRPRDLPQRDRAGRPVRSRGRRAARTRSGRRGPLRRGVLPGPPRREAGPALRRQLLPRAHRGDELPRRRPRPWRGRGGAADGHAPTHRGRASTPTGSTPCGSATRSPPAYRERRSTPSRPPTDTTGSSSRSSRSERTSATRCADRRPVSGRLAAGWRRRSRVHLP